MVMMGQLMDPERKKEDEDYVIQANGKVVQVQNLIQTEQNCVEKMKKREVPTLAFLAERTRQNLTEKLNSNSEENSQVKLDTQQQHKVFENGDGDGPKHENEQPLINEVANSAVAATENPSSGRASSCGGDSSGIGSSLTSSSSSEPIERDTSPSEENGGGSGGGAVEAARCSQDVPDSKNENAGGLSTSSEGDANVSLNKDDKDDDSCTALLLAEDFNGQMSAAKRFLKMVRDGIKDDDDVSTSRCPKSHSHGGSEPSTDDDSKPAILSNNSAKEKSSGGIGSGRAIKLSNGVVPIALTAIPTTHNNILGNGPPPDCVQEVWAHNLLEEFYKIRQVVKKYNFIAMDTEFPGIVVRPQSAVRSVGGMFPYELLKMNVDQLKIIQLGVTFMDKNGKTPEGVCTWQFNFKFNLKKDLFAPDSISLLTRCGIQFEKHEKMGIEPEMFGEYFMSSGMVTSDQVTYLTFHSGFDFGYLIKLLSNLPLPDNEEKFFEFMRIYFPNVYDLKFLMKSVDLHGGLQDIANQMGQQRVGTQHQAGSDSLLTGMTFFKILEDVFNGEIDDVKYLGKLYGFHMTAEDGRDEGWSEISGDILDPTSPKPPPPNPRTILPGSVVLPLPLPHHSIIASTNLNGDSGR